MQLRLEPLHQLVGPPELAGPNGQAEQDQRDAARAWNRTTNEAQDDKDEAEEADCDAIGGKLAFIFPDLATPAPAVLLRLDEYVVIVVVLMRMVTGRVRTIAGLRKVAVGRSASRELLSSTPGDMATTLR